MKIGYIRVSSIDQNLDRQRDVLEVDKVYEEKASAGNADRPVLRECIEFLREGDELHVVSIDRLARNLGDLQKIVETLTSRGVSVLFKKECLSFTGSNENPMSTLMFQMLGAFSQFERSLIRERQREGIAKAKAKGVVLGRPKVLTPQLIEEVKARCSVAGVNKSAVAKAMGIGRTTVYRAMEASA